MATAGSVLITRLYACLRVAAVATAAGVGTSPWASTSVPRVFYGLGGFYGGRSRGRLPFLDFAISGPGQTFGVRNNDGGDLETQVSVRAHVGGEDPETADNLSESILDACLVAIRDQAVDNYLKMGDQRIEPLAVGPWGHSRDAIITVLHSWSGSSFEQA